MERDLLKQKYLFHNITKLNEVTKQCVQVYEETTTSSGVLDIEAIVTRSGLK